MIKATSYFCAIALCATNVGVLAQDNAQQQTNPQLFEEILVTGGRDAVQTLPGSATIVDEQAIEEFNTTNIDWVMAQVPGVYIRQEDGYGLRPNIGIRGATSERSQKITFMEDGILISPAPYSAPAAYYLPNVNRMQAVEVFKGPSAIAYGPHTVGGAINLATPAVPDSLTSKLDLTLGNTNYRKLRATTGQTVGDWGYLIDALHYGADGFKELDNGENTGFERNDINAAWQWQSDTSASVQQWWLVKLGYADETSNETYLGLTDSDFAENPNRRYAASQNDEFESEHIQLHVIQGTDWSDAFSTTTRAYINRFDRAWNKFDGFFPDSFAGSDPWTGRVDAALALSSPTRLALIKGEADSGGLLAETLDVTNNAREYGSQGLDVRADWALTFGSMEHSIQLGARWHHDYVDRDHHARGYLMSDGQLVFDGVTDRPKKALNKAQTDALAIYLLDEISWHDWRFHLGARAERIEGEYTDHASGDSAKSDQDVFLPGAGVLYQFSDHWAALVGVNKGFSPSSPNPAGTTNAEESINYEYGVRLNYPQLTVDAIGFFSDYSNLLGRCRVSDAGCDAGDEYSAGAVEVGGLEFSGQWAASNGELLFPVSWAYTYTESAFQSSFNSSFSQWGNVQAGDELPYIPKHQGRIQVGIEGDNWQSGLAVRYTGELRESPGSSAPDESERTDSLTTLDVFAARQWSNGFGLRLVVENLTDEQVIVSRKPFGARPNAPRLGKLSVTYEF